MEEEGMDLEIIINPKDTEDGKAVIQVSYIRMAAQVPATKAIIVTRSLKRPPVPPSSTSRAVCQPFRSPGSPHGN